MYFFLPQLGPTPDYDDESAWAEGAQPLPRDVVDQMLRALPKPFRIERNAIIQQILSAVNTFQVFSHFDKKLRRWPAGKRRDYWRQLEKDVWPAAKAISRLLDAADSNPLAIERSAFHLAGDPIQRGIGSAVLVPPGWNVAHELRSLNSNLHWMLSVCGKCRADAETAMAQKGTEPHHGLLRQLGHIYGAVTGLDWTPPYWSAIEGTFKGSEFYEFTTPAITHLCAQ